MRFAPDAIPTLNTHLGGALLNGPSVAWSSYKADTPANYPNYVWLATADQLTSAPGTFTISVTTGWPAGKDPEDPPCVMSARARAVRERRATPCANGWRSHSPHRRLGHRDEAAEAGVDAAHGGPAPLLATAARSTP